MSKQPLEDLLDDRAAAEDKAAREYAQERNDAPCKKCRKADFVQLYRNVVGEVDGYMTGNFSLFGGSTTGYIHGETRTLPVLSCSNCHNERTIETWRYTYADKLFWADMHNFYFGVSDSKVDRFEDIPEYYLSRPRETRQYMLDNKNYKYDFYNEMLHWSPETWADAGFDIKFRQKRFLWFKWRVALPWSEQP